MEGEQVRRLVSGGETRTFFFIFKELKVFENFASLYRRASLSTSIVDEDSANSGGGDEHGTKGGGDDETGTESGGNDEDGTKGRCADDGNIVDRVQEEDSAGEKSDNEENSNDDGDEEDDGGLWEASQDVYDITDMGAEMTRALKIQSAIEEEDEDEDEE